MPRPADTTMESSWIHIPSSRLLNMGGDVHAAAAPPPRPPRSSLSPIRRTSAGGFDQSPPPPTIPARRLPSGGLQPSPVAAGQVRSFRGYTIPTRPSSRGCAPVRLDKSWANSELFGDLAHRAKDWLPYAAPEQAGEPAAASAVNSSLSLAPAVGSTPGGGSPAPMMRETLRAKRGAPWSAESWYHSSLSSFSGASIHSEQPEFPARPAGAVAAGLQAACEGVGLLSPRDVTALARCAAHAASQPQPVLDVFDCWCVVRGSRTGRWKPWALGGVSEGAHRAFVREMSRPGPLEAARQPTAWLNEMQRAGADERVWLLRELFAPNVRPAFSPAEVRRCRRRCPVANHAALLCALLTHSLEFLELDTAARIHVRHLLSGVAASPPPSPPSPVKTVEESEEGEGESWSEDTERRLMIRNVADFSAYEASQAAVQATRARQLWEVQESVIQQRDAQMAAAVAANATSAAISAAAVAAPLALELLNGWRVPAGAPAADAPLAAQLEYLHSVGWANALLPTHMSPSDSNRSLPPLPGLDGVSGERLLSAALQANLPLSRPGFVVVDRQSGAFGVQSAEICCAVATHCVHTLHRRFRIVDPAEEAAKQAQAAGKRMSLAQVGEEPSELLLVLEVSRPEPPLSKQEKKAAAKRRQKRMLQAAAADESTPSDRSAAAALVPQMTAAVDHTDDDPPGLGPPPRRRRRWVSIAQFAATASEWMLLHCPLQLRCPEGSTPGVTRLALPLYPAAPTAKELADDGDAGDRTAASPPPQQAAQLSVAITIPRRAKPGALFRAAFDGHMLLTRQRMPARASGSSGSVAQERHVPWVGAVDDAAASMVEGGGPALDDTLWELWAPSLDGMACACAIKVATACLPTYQLTIGAHPGRHCLGTAHLLNKNGTLRRRERCHGGCSRSTANSTNRESVAERTWSDERSLLRGQAMDVQAIQKVS
eukprot:COSAG01_NODE_3672_length_5809_cov_4.250263_2_plen_943_part_00